MSWVLKIFRAIRLATLLKFSIRYVSLDGIRDSIFTRKSGSSLQRAMNRRSRTRGCNWESVLIVIALPVSHCVTPIQIKAHITLSRASLSSVCPPFKASNRYRKEADMQSVSFLTGKQVYGRRTHSDYIKRNFTCPFQCVQHTRAILEFAVQFPGELYRY